MTWHYKKYRHNKKLFDYLHKNTSNFCDWEVITLFYSALHLINDYFTKNGPNVPINHSTRNIMIKQHLSDITDEYYTLYLLGRHARYNRFKITEKRRDIALNAFLTLESKIR